MSEIGCKVGVRGDNAMTVSLPSQHLGTIDSLLQICWDYPSTQTIQNRLHTSNRHSLPFTVRSICTGDGNICWELVEEHYVQQWVQILPMALVMARGSISVTGNLACHHWRQSQRLHPLFGSGENEVACMQVQPHWIFLGSAWVCCSCQSDQCSHFGWLRCLNSSEMGALPRNKNILEAPRAL